MEGLVGEHDDRAGVYAEAVCAREESAKRSGRALDRAALEDERQGIIETFDRQMGAIHTSSMLLDDGVIDPRDTRRVLSIVLATCREAETRQTRPIQYGVARL